jgi:hypothetical protein
MQTETKTRRPTGGSFGNRLRSDTAEPWQRMGGWMDLIVPQEVELIVR